MSRTLARRITGRNYRRLQGTRNRRLITRHRVTVREYLTDWAISSYTVTTHRLLNDSIAYCSTLKVSEPLSPSVPYADALGLMYTPTLRLAAPPKHEIASSTTQSHCKYATAGKTASQGLSASGSIAQMLRRVMATRLSHLSGTLVVHKPLKTSSRPGHTYLVPTHLLRISKCMHFMAFATTMVLLQGI